MKELFYGLLIGMTLGACAHYKTVTRFLGSAAATCCHTNALTNTCDAWYFDTTTCPGTHTPSVCLPGVWANTSGTCLDPPTVCCDRYPNASTMCRLYTSGTCG